MPEIPIELLSPARDLAVGRAAIDAGADAVYIGAPAFSARQAAGNSIADIAELCRYAHLFSCRVLVALNTLLTDEERQQAVKMAWQLYEAGADALIIQDLNLLQEHLPPIRLHASTQCDNRTLADVLDRQQRGFSQVVLARELSLAEIRQISESIHQFTNSPIHQLTSSPVHQLTSSPTIKLEAFIHGALCVSYSGRCYMSEHVCGRSANRGCCAQMCRLPYDLLDKDMREIAHQQYALSLRDLDRSQYLHELLDAGITTLKIEGRLKDIAYVRNITAYYRLLLDQLFAAPDSPYCRASKGNIHLDFQPDPEKTFHRSHTDYFLNGRTSHLANWETPKSTGEYIGKVTLVGRNYLEINTDKELHNGDGLCFGDKGFLVNSVDGRRVFPNQMPAIQVGDALYRNFDITFNRRLLYSRTTRRLPVDIILRETDDGFMLQIGDCKKHFPAEKTPADNPERALLTIRQQLSKLGDTPFEAATVTIDLRQPCFIPASTLNQWRREVVAKLTLTPSLPTAPTHTHLSSITPEFNSDIPTNSSTPQLVNLSTTLNTKHSTLNFSPLMTCRYCILFEMGMCRKERENKKGNERLNKNIAEPKYLRSGKNIFELRFDCHLCQMTIHQLTN